MRLDLNLATRTYIDARKVTVAFAVVIGLLSLLLVINTKNAASAFGEARKLRREIAELDEKFRVAGGGVTEKDYRQTVASIAEANRMIERKALNWLALLDLLEATVPDGVGITAVTPSLKDNRLSLGGETTSFRNIRQFMENLEGSTQFSDVYLLNQTVPAPGEPFTFTISCSINLKAL